MNDHAERLRHMAAGWLQSARDEEQLNAGLNLHSGAMIATKQSIAHYRAQAAALLAGAEALERERSTVEWGEEGGATKNGLYLWAGPCVNGFASLVQRGRRRLYLDWHPTLEAAQAAAVAWVDEQEGKDV